MNAIWHSVENLSRLNSHLQLAVAVAGVVTALLCVLSWIASERLAELEDAQTAELQNRIRTAEKDAAEARKEAEAVATRQKPRTLTLFQEEALIGVLRGNEKGAVTITAVMSDPGAERFAFQLYEAFRKSGWEPKGVNLAMMSPAPSGLFLKVSSARPPLAHAIVVQRALTAAQVEAPGVVDAPLEPSVVEIVVGHKP